LVAAVIELRLPARPPPPMLRTLPFHALAPPLSALFSGKPTRMPMRWFWSTA
jgi:hypothetical protein